MKIILGIFSIVLFASLFFWGRSDFALPIFCTTRGCVTNQDWKKEKQYQTIFANAAHSSIPSDSLILTTLVRKHLIEDVRTNEHISEEATKYRTEILHLTDTEDLKRLGFDSFAEYDRVVIIPFLFQRAYMNEHGFTTPQEAYVNLSKNFRVVSLLFEYTWDSSKGEVVTR